MLKKVCVKCFFLPLLYTSCYLVCKLHSREITLATMLDDDDDRNNKASYISLVIQHGGDDVSCKLSVPAVCNRFVRHVLISKGK